MDSFCHLLEKPKETFKAPPYVNTDSSNSSIQGRPVVGAAHLTCSPRGPGCFPAFLSLAGPAVGLGLNCICRAGDGDQKSHTTYTFTESARLCCVTCACRSPSLSPGQPVWKMRRLQLPAARPSNLHLPEGKHPDTLSPHCGMQTDGFVSRTL